MFWSPYRELIVPSFKLWSDICHDMFSFGRCTMVLGLERLSEGFHQSSSHPSKGEEVPSCSSYRQHARREEIGWTLQPATLPNSQILSQRQGHPLPRWVTSLTCFFIISHMWSPRNFGFILTHQVAAEFATSSSGSSRSKRRPWNLDTTKQTTTTRTEEKQVEKFTFEKKKTFLFQALRTITLLKSQALQSYLVFWLASIPVQSRKKHVAHNCQTWTPRQKYFLFSLDFFKAATTLPCMICIPSPLQ
jgi:hypothetical protein